tara:strand:+ start:470 stop:1000 length:531 start_codon:yes stop_codon:yes gene_type:complete
MEVFNFFGKKKEGRELSNFWERRVEVDGRVYGSGEAAFHGSKYIEVSKVSEGERRGLLEEYGRKFEIGEEFGSMNGGELKKKGGIKGMKLNEDEIGVWNRMGVVVQEKICRYKYDNYEVVKEVLESSRNKILVHPAMRCNDEKVRSRLWEGRVVDGVILGGNMLGNIWMKIRDVTV